MTDAASLHSFSYSSSFKKNLTRWARLRPPVVVVFTFSSVCIIWISSFNFSKFCCRFYSTGVWGSPHLSHFVSTNAVLVKKSRRTTSPHHFKVTPHVKLAVLPSEKAHKVALTKQKKDPYLHTRITGNTKKRTAHVR